jgi:hypothetical protein
MADRWFDMAIGRTIVVVLRPGEKFFLEAV